MFLEIQNIHKYFNDLHVLKGVSTNVDKGEVLSIIGPSGSGKSTFLKCLNYLEYPSEGKVSLNNQRIGFDLKDNLLSEKQICVQRRKFGMVFQDFNLFWHMNLLENIIEAPIRVLKWKRKIAIEKAEELINKVGLYEKRFSYPRKLSGGQQQRGAIARALAMDPDVMLFDEPTSALDPETIGEVLKVIENLAMEGMTMLVVTHEINFAKNLSNRVMMLDEGRVIEDLDTHAFFNSKENIRKTEFLKHVQ